VRLDAHANHIDYRAARGIRKDKMATLLSGQYLHYAHNIIITGATGCGKIYLSCALGQQACEQHHTVKYYRLGQLLDELNIGHADGSYRQQLAQLAKKKLLILDDWGMEKRNARQANDLLDVMEDRYQNASTIIASQIPVTEWYKLITNPTVADALLDRLLHNSHGIELAGESMRKLDQSDQLA
jgi:DNA replication protein DnaC